MHEYTDFLCAKIKDNAVIPSKKRNSDSGYDITLVEKVKQEGDLEYYTTNLRVRPPYGYYFDMVPRSSMPKTGYALANGVGIIDRTYTGPIMAVLYKVDKNAPELELPAKILQIIPRPIVHFEIVVVDELPETERKDGAFGSTGDK